MTNKMIPHTKPSATSTDCWCHGPEQGKMIACDNQTCSVEWFHFSCVGLHRKPKGKWDCSDSCKLQATTNKHKNYPCNSNIKITLS